MSSKELFCSDVGNTGVISKSKEQKGDEMRKITIFPLANTGGSGNTVLYDTNRQQSKKVFVSG